MTMSTMTFDDATRVLKRLRGMLFFCAAAHAGSETAQAFEEKAEALDVLLSTSHRSNLTAAPTDEHVLLCHDGLPCEKFHPSVASPAGFYIACFKNPSRGEPVLWWAPDNRGYTPDLETAGIYAEPVPGYHDSDENVPVPVSLIQSLRVRRIVDPGDSLNGAFHNAAMLRAMLAAPPTVGPEKPKKPGPADSRACLARMGLGDYADDEPRGLLDPCGFNPVLPEYDRSAVSKSGFTAHDPVTCRAAFRTDAETHPDCPLVDPGAMARHEREEALSRRLAEDRNDG